MKGQNILLIPYGTFDKDFLDKIAKELSKEFLYPVHIIEILPELADFYDPERRQYNGNALLKYVDSFNSPGTPKKIGLFRVDLFIPILTYIFGQASLNGDSGIASIYRLRNEQYGIPKNESLLFERFLKVVVHELGHTFGLKHCHVPTCVMRSSTYVEDLDQKSSKFCNNCKNHIITEGRIKNDVTL